MSAVPGRFVIGGALAFALAFAGCQGGDARAWIEAARAASDAAADAPDDEAERAALQRLLALEVPSSVAADDARVIRQDGHERLARLLLRQGDPASALREVDRGLALGRADDIFTANLWVTRGRILEHRGQDREAARDYHRAMLIHEALLDAALGGE